MSGPAKNHELALGTIVDRKYQVIRRLGEGGMGRVYEARRLTLGDTVAIKCILSHRNTATNRERFLREARAAARIRHPNVVQVFDFGELDDAGTPYMVMEMLAGPTLSEVIADGMLPPERARTIFGRICAAIEAGHRRGVVHRDIKPGNVILARSDDGGEAVKVLDFGLARVMTGAGELSAPQALVGTADYMSPEQVRGDPVSPASDVFSLAVLLYELFVGKRPFHGTTVVNTLFRISEGSYDPPGPRVEGPVAAAIREGLAPEPRDRPRSALALAELAGVAMGAREPEVYEVSQTATLSVPTRRATGSGVVDPAQITHDEASRLTAIETVGSTFVGRDVELQAIDEELRVAARGDARVTLFIGEAGSGKTQLLDEAARRLGAGGAHVVRGRFFAYAADRPPPDGLSWLVDEPGAVEATLGAMTQPTASEDSSDGARAGADPGQAKWQRFETATQAVLQRAGDRTLAILLDDLQWAGTLDLELLSYVRFKASGRPMLVVATTRPDLPDELRSLVAKLASTRSLRKLMLTPLTIQATHAFLHASFHPLRIAPPDVRRIHHVTSGSPYALVELSRQLVDGGRIHPADTAADDGSGEGTGWVCDDLFDVGLPDSVQTVVEAQLSELPEALRGVLELCAVIGEQLRFETVLQASGETEDALEQQLEAAVKRRILSEQGLGPGADFRFSSAALRQVLYDGLSPRKRRRLHRQVVEALRQQSLEGRMAEVLTYHYRAIGDWAQTFEQGTRAAARALDHHDADAAQAALAAATEASEHLELDVRQQAEHARLQGTLFERLGRFDEAVTSLQRAASLADALDDEDAQASLRLDVTLSLAECELGRGHFEQSATWASRAIEHAQARGDRARALLGRIRFAGAAGPLGRIPEAHAQIDPVLQTTEARFALHRALAGREKAWLLVKTGAFAEAQRAAQRAIEQARVAGDALAQYRAQSALGLVHAECGDYPAAIEQLGVALELARGLSLRRREGIEQCNIGECHLLSGNAAQGLKLTQQGLAIFVEIGDTASEGDCRVNLGRMLRQLGRRNEAIAMLDRGRRACRASGRVEYEAVALTELAELHAEEGKPLLARALYARAARRYESIAAFQHWQALFGVARMDARLGDGARAQAGARQALAQVEAQLADVPAGVDASTLERSRAELGRFLAEPEGETLIDDINPQATREALEQQHAQLQATAQRVLGLASRLHEPEALVSLHATLAEFDAQLREHSETETAGLYFQLLRHDDVEVRERATDLYTDGMGLYEAYFEFTERWSDPAAIEAKRGDFAEELGKVFRHLYQRMHTEERELHPLAEAIPSAGDVPG